MSNAVSGNFQLIPLIGVIVWYAIGIYMTWLFFRKMDLDFRFIRHRNFSY